MESKYQVNCPKDAPQHRHRSVSVLSRSDSTQFSAASRYAEYAEASAAQRLLPTTYERLPVARRAQDGLTDRVRADFLLMRQRRYENRRRAREFRKSAAREKREREETQRRQHMSDVKRAIQELETSRAIEEERPTEAVRREATSFSIREFMTRRDEAARYRRLEQAILLAEHMEAEARTEETQTQAQEEADEREFIHPERLRECAVCMEKDDMGSMIQAHCTHWYCRVGLKTAFQNALYDRQPFRCCRLEIPIDLCPYTTEDFRERYSLMVLESTTRNPVYCSNRACRVFVPPAQYQGPDTAACRACGTATCRMCWNAAHNGICPEDVGLQQPVSLAASKGWRPCPSCNNMVEKGVGCNHITCRCGGQFCYVCGSVWGSCREH
ncbi:hypothetical protein F5Y01DRAFT_275719 [Xylaria sp. FL0043]|nr:hypothetical protein F5Y01DRAFT_275719 [Xylaria sp. FL0043]